MQYLRAGHRVNLLMSELNTFFLFSTFAIAVSGSSNAGDVSAAAAVVLVLVWRWWQ